MKQSTLPFPGFRIQFILTAIVMVVIVSLLSPPILVHAKRPPDTAPSPPSGVTASDGTYADKVRITWNSVPGSDFYQVWYDQNSNPGGATELGGTTATSFNDTLIPVGTTYYYFIKACTYDACSDFSESDTGYRTLAPTGVAATDDLTDKITVSWTDSTGATSYQVWRNTVQDTASATQVGTPATSPFDDTSAAEGNQYWYWVKACNTGGCTDFSTDTDQGYRKYFIPPIPTGVQASDDTYTDKVAITWDAMPDAEFYEVWRNTSDTTTGAASQGSPTGTSFDDTSAVAGQAYYYFIKACSSNGCSDFSAGDSGSRSVVPPLGAFNGGAELISDQPIVAIGRPHIGTEIMAYNGANAGANTVYLPMLFNNKWGYTSTFTVQNTGAGTATYSLTFKDAADGSTSCVISGESLPVHGVKTYDVTNLGPCDGGSLPNDWFGGATVSSDQPMVAVAKPNINGTDAVTYNGFTGGATTVYLPMLFRGMWGYQSAFYVQNLDLAESAVLELSFYDSQGSHTCTMTDSNPIQSSVTRGYWMADLDNANCDSGPGFSASGWAGSAVITITGGGSTQIVAIGRPHLGAEVAAYNGFSSGGTTNYLPMLFRGQWGYDAAFYVQNISGSNTAVSVDFYDVDGNYTCTYNDTVELLPNATRGYWTPSLTCNAGGSFPGGGWAGSAKVTSSQNVIAVGRPHLSNGQVVVYNAFTSGGISVYVPMMFRTWNGNETALYIQNLDASLDANVTITFYDEESGFFCAMDQVVAPGAAGAIWLAALDNTVCVP